MRNLVALVGFKGSGKNSAAEYLINEGNFAPLAFADALKDCLATTFCWCRSDLEGVTAASRAWREKVDPWWAKKLGIPHFTPRWAMTNFGTDVMRRFFHDDIWLLNVERRMTDIAEDRSVIITDVRYSNEIGFVQRLGGRLARIARGDDPEWWDVALIANKGENEQHRRDAAHLLENHYDIHSSEWAWVGHEFVHVIRNDGSLDDLRAHMIAFAGDTA